MAGFMQNAMQYLGMSDPSDAEEEPRESNGESATFDTDRSVAPVMSSLEAPSLATAVSSARGSDPVAKPSALSRIATIHPKAYNDVQMVGRALLAGIPVVLNLSDVSEAVAYRIVDFASGLTVGVQGHIERVTSRVFLLSPAQVNIKVESSESENAARNLFTS